MTPDYVIVIPARHDSVRLPGKALADIGGRPMVEHTWRAARASGARQVVVATDDKRIFDVVSAFGGQAVMTDRGHASGSDRIAECASLMGWSDMQLVVNLQGDEPEMPPQCLDQVAALLAAHEHAAVSTLYWPVATRQERDDPNVVKVAVSGTGNALYFSRAAIPHARGEADLDTALRNGVPWCRHLGLYCYRVRVLKRFAAWPPGLLEGTERLEQLRFLEHGERIVIAKAASAIPPGIDTPEGLAAARARISDVTD